MIVMIRWYIKVNVNKSLITLFLKFIVNIWMYKVVITLKIKIDWLNFSLMYKNY